MPTAILDGETYEQARHRRFTEEAKVIEKMQQDEIIRAAREAGFSVGLDDPIIYAAHERFAALVAAHEREACAKECDYWAKRAEERGYTCKGETHIDGFGDGAAACAAAIRARGEK